MKIKLEKKSTSKNDYDHLTPIVDFLISQGCKPKHDYLWGVNRTGFFCHLNGDVDIEIINGAFEFPESIIINEKLKQIDCLTTYSVIKFGF